MKILQVVNAYYPPYSAGGPAFVAHNVSKALARRGHAVTVFTTNALTQNSLFQPKQNPNYDEGVEIHYFGNMIYKTSHQIYFSKKLVSALRKSIAQYDIVHLHEYRSYIGFVTDYYAKKHNIRYVLQPHGQLPRILGKQRLKWIYDVFFGYRLLRDASKVIALTSMEAEQCRRMGVSEEKIAIIPNGIDLSEYANLPPRGAFRKKFGIDEDEKMILYLGRIHRIKGLDIVAKAFSKVVKELDGVKLVVAGPDDGYLDELVSLIRILKIEDTVLIPGPLYGQDKFEAYVDADLFVLPSRYDIWGMTVLEAVLCRTPIILSENCGIASYFKDREGLVVESSPRRLGDAILRKLQHPESKNVLEESYKKLIDEFDAVKIVSKLEEIYTQAMSNY